MPNLLLTSYKIHDEVHAASSPELCAWLDANAKKWRVQVMWRLPDGDTDRLKELATVFRALMLVVNDKRAKAIGRLASKVEAVLGEPVAAPTAAEVVAKLAEPTLKGIAGVLVQANQDALKGMMAQVPADAPAEAVETVEKALAESETPAKPAPEPEPEPEVEDEPEATEAPEVAPEPEAPQTPAEPVPAPEPALVAQVTCPARPLALRRLELEDQPDIPPPEKRAKVMLGNLFRRISSGG